MRGRELVKPPPSLRELQQLHRTALLAMALAGTIAIVDGIAANEVLLISLLAIPPVIAAMSASTPETAVVGAFCVMMAALSGLWNQNLGSGEYIVEILVTAAGSVAGLWVASLRTNLNREQDAADLLAETGSLLEDTLDQRARAEHLARLAVPALGNAAAVDLCSPDGSIHRASATSNEKGVAEALLELRRRAPIQRDGPHPIAKAIRTGETQVVDRPSRTELAAIAFHEGEEQLLYWQRAREILVVPLKGRDSVLGALTVSVTDPAHGYDPQARLTLERLAERAALALDNARLHEQQAHIAAVLQHSLLPRSLPEIAGFEAASRFLAAGEGYEVGGDFYDVFPTGTRNWTIVIGDVCGKGPEAAALTALARYTVRTASNAGTQPSAVLRALHDSIRAERSDLRFCTAALARVRAPANGGRAKLTVALGGHPPPLALRRDGRVESIGRPGTLLGAFPSPHLADADGSLGRGDALVLYTDGILERRDRKQTEDPERWLVRQLAGAEGGSADEIAEQLAQAAITRQGGEPRDDIAILVLRRNGAT